MNTVHPHHRNSYHGHVCGLVTYVTLFRVACGFRIRCGIQNDAAAAAPVQQACCVTAPDAIADPGGNDRTSAILWNCHYITAKSQGNSVTHKHGQNHATCDHVSPCCPLGIGQYCRLHA